MLRLQQDSSGPGGGADTTSTPIFVQENQETCIMNALYLGNRPFFLKKKKCLRELPASPLSPLLSPPESLLICQSDDFPAQIARLR